jgi:ATP-binding protein involved in chromosome partitioning
MNTPLRPDQAALFAVLDTIEDPLSGKGLVASGRVQGLVAQPDGRVICALEVPPDAVLDYEPVRLRAEAVLAVQQGVSGVAVALTAHSEGPAAGVTRVRKGASLSPAAEAQSAPPPRTAAGPLGIKAVIAVASAKGGVGKSTLAVNLACAFARLGLKTGLLDADVYGPSAPTLLGLADAEPRTGPDKKLIPIEAFGLKTMSIGYLVAVDAPMIWRGPMASSAIRQMLDDVAWGELDVLVLDMPPGTGDVQLTIAQRLPLAGAIIVSTPQEVALADVRRGIAMFEKTHVPVLGVIENMAWLEQPGGKRLHIFGEGGARRTAEAAGAPFLGELPLDIALRESADRGRPLVATAPGSLTAKRFLDFAETALANLDTAAKPPPTIRFE